MIIVGEYIIQWNCGGSLDLYEYTKDKKLNKILNSTYALNVIDFISSVQNPCYVWIERMPISHLIIPEFDKLNNIQYGYKEEAERFSRQMYRKGNRNITYVSYWEMFKPTTWDEIEKICFDYKLF